MIGLQRSKLSAIPQFVFFCENVSVAAANNEISVELGDLNCGCILSFELVRDEETVAA